MAKEASTVRMTPNEKRLSQARAQQLGHKSLASYIRATVLALRARVALELGLRRYPEQQQDAYLIRRCLDRGIRQELSSWSLAGLGEGAEAAVRAPGPIRSRWIS